MKQTTKVSEDADKLSDSDDAIEEEMKKEAEKAQQHRKLFQVSEY
jgi:hypothetical protein|tara:strand:- start:259 stop:393 length:135 start_codon:yes stop_codon:yes gene_type:complete